MHIFPVARFFSSSLLLTMLALAGSAHADSVENERDVANSLLPLETRSADIVGNPSLFKSVINEINIDNPTATDNANLDDITEVVGAGFLEGLVDDNGDVDLPLGITVFEAMGTTSVGFGGDF